MSTPKMGRIGIWSIEMRFGDHAKTERIAAELDEMGFGTLWIPGALDGEVLPDVERLLAATKRMTIATGILNLWKHEPADVASWFAALPDDKQERTMIGIGISHGPVIGENWNKPLARTRQFLDDLEAAGMPLENTCLAALGPKMIELSGKRTAGAHPYMTTPEHTARARKILGPGKLLMPDQKVAFATSREKVLEIAREGLGRYGELPNYRNNLLSLGFTESDIDGPSDRFADALLASGEAKDMVGHVNAHFDAGADHVCIQVLSGAVGSGDLDELARNYRSLAEVFL